MYEKNVQWSVNNYNYVFQLPFEECLIDTKSEDVPKLFIFSSFLMPLPKDKYIQEFEKLKFEVNDYSASISVYTNVNNEIIAFKNIKEELKETRKKSGR